MTSIVRFGSVENHVEFFIQGPTLSSNHFGSKRLELSVCVSSLDLFDRFWTLFSHYLRVRQSLTYSFSMRVGLLPQRRGPTRTVVH